MRCFAVLVGLSLGACGGGAVGDDVSSDPDAGGVCDPTGGGPLWLEEGETVSATIACATGAEPGDGGFEVGPLPDGASYDPATRLLSFSPGLDQAAVYRIALAAPSVAEAGELKIGVADRFDDPENIPVVDPLAYTEEYGLPVLFVSPAPTDSEIYQPVSVVYGGRSYAIEGKLRGKSSLSYPKQSYTLNFAGDHLEDPAHGFVDTKKLVLTTTFDDNSYLRVRMTWELWNRLDPTVTVASASAIVFLDGAYYGLYAISDHIDDELMARSGLPETGNLYKAVNHDANFALTASGGGGKSTLHDGYEKKHGLPEAGQAGAFDDLEDLVDFVATADDASFGAELESRVYLPDFEAWWLIATFLRLDDSAGKNSYLHHSATSPWHAVPWDFNAGFGQSWYTSREAATPIYHYENHNRLFARLMTHPDFAAELGARYAAELREGGAFELATVAARIDALEVELAAGAARDERRWRNQYLSFSRWSSRTDFTTFGEEIAYVRQWIGQRWSALAAEYP